MKNKLISAILSVVLICSAATVLSFAGNTKTGDLNGDGDVTSADARIALRISAQLETADDAVMKAADVNHDGKVTASDARLIMRVAAQLDKFPEEVMSDTEVEPEPEPDPEPDTGVIAENHPEIINTFISGKYYIDGAFVDGDEVTPLKMATDGTEVEMKAEIDGVTVSVMSEGSKMYLKFAGSDGTPYYLDESTLSEIGVTASELGFSKSKVLDGFIFGPVNRLVAPILTTEEVNGEECSVYSFKKKSGGFIVFYFDAEENLIMINGKDAEGNIQPGLLINSLSAEIPEDMLTLDGFSAGTIWDLFAVLPD